MKILTISEMVLEDISAEVEKEREERNKADMQKLKDWVRA